MQDPDRGLAAAHQALAQLVDAQGVGRLCVAYSGGADSTALLHLASAWGARRGVPVRVHHVDHGLHPRSAAWAEFCAARARELGLPYTCTRVTSAPPPGASVEAWAREARYAALAAGCAADEAVLTAHHREDQVETVMQRIVHAAGPHGLAGIPALRTLGHGWLARPLLGCTRDSLRSYLAGRAARWIDDPANSDVRYLRNRLRHTAWPALAAAVPGAADGLVRLAALQQALARGLDGYADALLGTAATRALPVAVLERAPLDLRPYVLRRFLDRAACLPIGARALRAILDSVCAARVDAAPTVSWGGHAVRRYRGVLYVMSEPLAPVPEVPQAWYRDDELHLSCGRLCAVRAADGELDAGRLDAADRVVVDFRRGGERCRPAGRRHHHALKKLFQDWGVPPWERERTPLLYLDGELAAVVGHCVCAGFAAPPGRPAYRLDWMPI